LKKTNFDARAGSTDKTADFYDNPWKYSFTHNFKVHFKRGALQALANKVDITLSSATPEIPSTQQVVDEFNQRMKASIFESDTRRRYSAASYHVTQVEYKETLAFYDPQMALKAPPKPASSSQASDSLFCRNCGASLPSDSKFCTKCGTHVL
jgi:ribosomal protein L40E